MSSSRCASFCSLTGRLFHSTASCSSVASAATLPKVVTESEAPPVEIEITTHELIVNSLQHNLHHAKFPWLWLRDACQAPHSVDPSSRQKLFRTSDIPLSIRAKSCAINTSSQVPSIEIQWNEPLLPRASGNSILSQYPLDFLSRYANRESWLDYHYRNEMLSVPWDLNRIERVNLKIPYANLNQPTVLLAALKQLITYGIVFFTDVPCSEKSNEHCELVNLSNILGEIRRTWYGDKVWDVQSIKDAKNIAYTNLDLGLHMDLVHFETPPRFQLLHYLHQHPTLKGGESYFVDAYKIAEILKAEFPQDYLTLCTAPVAFEYHNGGHWRHWERPTFELSTTQPGLLHAVNYSPPFQAPQLVNQNVDTTALHRALTRFASLSDDPQFIYQIAMKPGDCVAFDNRRVLHARTAFTWDSNEKSNQSQVGRWLKGSYVEGDSVEERLRVLLSEQSLKL